MKRNIYIFTLVLSLLSLSVFSQSLSLKKRYTNTPIANDETITVRYSLDSNVQHVWDSLIVSNVTGHPLNVMVKKTLISVVDGTVNSMCWGMCVEPFVFVAGPVEMPGITDTVIFSSDYYIENKTGISIIRYTFYSESNPTDSICFKIKYIHPPDAGINEMYKNYLFTNAYPNPVNNVTSINYSYSLDVNKASIVVNDLLGKVVKEIPLSAKQGKVSISTVDIANGIYLYSLQLNGKTVNTRKLIVNH
jgi:hypothetical protein